VASGKISRRRQLQEYLQRSRWSVIGEPEFRQLVTDLAPIPEDALRRLLRDCDTPLAPLVEGVRQGSFDELERTLTALAGEYAVSAPGRRRAIRRLVIVARDRARLAARRGGKAAAKTEMALWMDTWLGNPEAFPLWLGLRKTAPAFAEADRAE
jgi:hypothetical protein